MKNLAFATTIILSIVLIAGCSGNPPKQEAVVTRVATGRTANAVLLVLVDTLGRPADIVIRHSSGNKVADAAIMRAAKTWKFEPNVVDGKPTPEWREVPVNLKPGVI